jgi:drug/metabolite transporter (DMT)-like permease
MINILLIVIYVLLTVSGLIFLKLGGTSSQITSITKGILHLQISFISLIGLGCYICSFFIYLFLLSRNTLSFLMPVMTGLVYISVLTASLLILKEKISLFSLIGSLFILLGLIMVVFKGK